MMATYRAGKSAVKIKGIESRILEKVLQAQVCLSDLDDTDAASPARFVALQNWKSRMVHDSAYRNWFIRTGRQYLFNKDYESRSWKEYVDIFLRSGERWNEHEYTQIDQLISSEQIVASVFPGVPEFYDILSAQKYYVSRNIPLIVQKYGQQLGFCDTFGEVYDKAHFVENFVREHSSVEHYLVRGDSEEDKEMLKTLQSCVRSLKIKSVVGIFVGDNAQASNGFEICTSRNQTKLAELLRSCE